MTRGDGAAGPYAVRHAVPGVFVTGPQQLAGMVPVPAPKSVHEDESGYRRHLVHHDLRPFGIEPVEQPVALEPQLVQRLRLDEVPLVHRPPFGVGDRDGDERHHLVLLTLQMWQQCVAQSAQGVEQRDPGAADRSVREVAGRVVTRLDPRSDAQVVGFDRRDQRCRTRFPRPHERPQPVVLAVVMRAQEAHHPTDVRADGRSLLSLGIGRVLERVDRAIEVAAQRIVDNAHHPRVGGCGVNARHDSPSPTGVRRRTIASVSHCS